MCEVRFIYRWYLPREEVCKILGVSVSWNEKALEQLILDSVPYPPRSKSSTTYMVDIIFNIRLRAKTTFK